MPPNSISWSCSAATAPCWAWPVVVGRFVPLFGINFGRVGFLTDAQPEHWKERLVACLKGELAVRTCLALSWKLTRGGSLQAGGSAVNDVVLSRGSLSRLVCVNISVDGQRMGLLRSDGIILSTPVGSSGYSASAGGPLLYSGMNAVAFRPSVLFEYYFYGLSGQDRVQHAH